MNDVMKSMLKFKAAADEVEKAAEADGKKLKTYFVTGTGAVANLDEEKKNEETDLS